MKLLLIPLLALGFQSIGSADQPPAAPLPVLESVTKAHGGKTLVVSFSTNGIQEKLSFDFPEPILDFRYCPWLRGHGIAVVARTGDQKSASYYWNLSVLDAKLTQTNPGKLDAPTDVLPVLGIGNPDGDSLVITAMSHHRGKAESVNGWVYVHTCPFPGDEGGKVTLIPRVELQNPKSPYALPKPNPANNSANNTKSLEDPPPPPEK